MFLTVILTTVTISFGVKQILKETQEEEPKDLLGEQPLHTEKTLAVVLLLPLSQKLLLPKKFNFGLPLF